MKIILTLVSVLFIQGLYAQFQLPKYEYDDVEILMEEGNVYQKNFKKEGELLLEVYYPHNKMIQSLCFKSRVAADSVYIFHAPVFKEISFWQRNGDVGVTTWSDQSNLVVFETFFSDGQLKRKYSGVAQLDLKGGHPACAENYFNVGESIRYSDDREEISYMNYTTGEGRFSDRNVPESTKKSLTALKKQADEIVRKNYGDSFYRQFIRPNYRKTAAYHPSSPSYRRNNGMPNKIREGDSWFLPEDEKVTFADISYYIELENNRLFDLITIRLDSAGNLVNQADHSSSSKPNFTEGLLENPGPPKFLNETQALALAKKEGLPADDPDLKVGLKWISSEKSGSTGKLYYQFLFNKLNKRPYGCNMFFYEEWLIDPFTKEIIKDGEESYGDCMPGFVQRRKEGEKYGFVDGMPDGDGPIIPFEYDEVPRNFSHCMIVKKEEKYGCINTKNEVLVPFIYDHISYVDFEQKRYMEDFLIVKNGEKVGLFDKKGRELLPVEYTGIKSKDAHSIIAVKNEKATAIYNCKTGKVQKL